MDITMIGKRITSIRKEKGHRQEDLANYVGVTAQAVSKWENGGVPDTELIPKIADFFGVSIDTLFGRSITDYSDIESAIISKITSVPWEQRLREAFEMCWTIEGALIGGELPEKSLSEISEAYDKNDEMYSSVQTDDGYVEMGLFNRLSYFLIVPDADDKELAYFNGIDYVSLFRDLSDEDVFRSLVYLNKRESKNAFTPKLLVKELGLSLEKAGAVIQTLEKFGVIEKTFAEIDDESVELFTFQPNPSFPSMLIFAREMIDHSKGFYGYCGGRQRPYLK